MLSERKQTPKSLYLMIPFHKILRRVKSELYKHPATVKQETTCPSPDKYSGNVGWYHLSWKIHLSWKFPQIHECISVTCISNNMHVCVCVCVCVYVSVCLCARPFSHAWLFATLWPVACQPPLSMEFSRQEFWNGLPFPTPADLPSLGIKPKFPAVPALAGGFLTTAPPGKHLMTYRHNNNKQLLPLSAC